MGKIELKTELISSAGVGFLDYIAECRRAKQNLKDATLRAVRSLQLGAADFDACVRAQCRGGAQRH